MPHYAFRCKQCRHEFSAFYKSVRDYAAATPTCPRCGSAQLARVIDRVAIQAPTRDFTRMNANEMLSVFESGDSRQVGQMFEQVSGTHPALAAQYHEATKQLLAGESMDKVEKRLQDQQQDAAAGKKPKKKSP